ncbi:hypothetical protein T12_952 [Trichinella patagoniensis]|uniref:Uncharacterized protein n=1 Tax=Trichinella patagoniensis TaxID=990121 RepID=A0A0V0ZJI8_9BILA|nr:hypothetical protein T12_952 [Trichinella patagoniensis]
MTFTRFSVEPIMPTFQVSQLTDFPMYRLAEVEVAALYPRIREVALITGLRLTTRIAALWSIIDFPPDI